MAERTGRSVSDEQCKHCGMTHEPWRLVCPATRRPIRVGGPPAKGAPALPVIPPAVAVPSAVPGGNAPMGGKAASDRLRPAAPVGPMAAATQARSSRSSYPPVIPPALQELAGRVVGERYRLSRVIGEGGMGVVYEAEHLGLGRQVAVKVLHPKRAQDREAISRLRHEARVAGTLGHPNICAIHDLGRLDDGSPYLVMERLYGETLAQRLKSEGTIPVEDLVDIMLQVLSALAAAHQRGIIHRDLKPDNIFLSRREGMSPIPKLLDFGISKAEDIEDTMDATGVGMAAGTPFYMAPEQARGDRVFDHRVDLWAAGVILYECLTGQRPFVANNYNALLVQILTAAPRHVRELAPRAPIALCRIVDKLLSKNPNDRFQSVGEVQIAMRALADPDAAPRSVRDPDVAPRSVRMPESAPRSVRVPESAPRSSARIPPSLPVPLPVPRVVDEPTNDDSDSTYIFSRFDLGALESDDGQHAALDDSEEKTRVYMPFTDDDERTVVDPPSFAGDGGAGSRPGSTDPRQKR